MIRKLVLLLTFSILLVSLASAAVKINEIKPKGVEWIEIYNPDEESLNLSLWTIDDNLTDKYYPDTLCCTEIPECNLETNAKYFLILGQSAKIENITSEDVVYFYVDDQYIGNKLNDDGDAITIKENNETIDSAEYGTIENSSFSFQFVDGAWYAGVPTPGEDNKCTEETPPAEEPENESVPQDNETLNETITGNDNETASDGGADTENESADIASAAGQTTAKKNITTQAANENTSSESKKVIYQSKNEKTRETAIYLLIALLILIIIYLIKSKNI